MAFELDQIRYLHDGEPVTKSLEIPEITEEGYKERLKEINETYKIIHDSRTGRAFEIAIVNKDSLANGAILMPSTMFSSLTQNVGNAVELAAHGAALPDIARVYVTFPGNGGSSNLSRQDRQYLVQTGRFTQENGQPLESISALVNALDDHDIPIKSISANVEAGRLGLGILAALPAQSVTAVYLNGLPGISHENFVPVMIHEDHGGQEARRLEADDEVYRVNDQRCEEAKAFLPKIYQGVNHVSLLLSTYFRAFPNMQAYTKAFDSYKDLNLLDQHAVFQDTLVALQRQQYANITFQFGKYSKLHDIQMCKMFGQKLAEKLSQISYQGRLQLFLYPGSLDWHTSAPGRRWAIEKSVLIDG